jgi:hypothetical protein
MCQPSGSATVSRWFRWLEGSVASLESQACFNNSYEKVLLACRSGDYPRGWQVVV